MNHQKQLILAATFLVFALPLAASPVYGTAAPESGNVTLLGFSHWTGYSSLAWNITPVAGGYLYEYAFTHGEKGGLSHLVLEFTAGCASDPGCITQATNSPDGPRTYAALTPPNFEMPASIYGVKFDFDDGDDTTNYWSFVSNRAPVYGNIYARDGGNGHAYNQGLLVLDSMNRRDFVARPDGGSPEPVPEPATLGMLALGFGFLAWKCRS